MRSPPSGRSIVSARLISASVRSVHAISAVDPSTLSESELMEWALPRAANQFWMLSEPERATAFLQATRNRVSSPTARTTLDALSATFAMNAGSPQRAMQIATEVLAAPTADDTAIGWAAAAAALSCASWARLRSTSQPIRRTCCSMPSP